jgi:hypothetical protein
MSQVERLLAPMRASIVDKDPTGPLVRCYDVSGGAVMGLVDATVQGITS